MNNIYINEIIKNESLTSKAAAVLHNLALHSNKENECFPALKTIARECRLSVRTVQRALDELLSVGLITKKHNYRANGSQTSNIYRIIEAASDRAAAAAENAMLKMRDLRRRMEAAAAKKAQQSICITPKANNDGILQHIKATFASMAQAFKNEHLARGDSQTDHPGTLTY